MEQTIALKNFRVKLIIHTESAIFSHQNHHKMIPLAQHQETSHDEAAFVTPTPTPKKTKNNLHEKK